MTEVKEMTIPLRAAWNVPRTKRANRAMAEIKRHVAQHMKIQEDEEIWIDQAVNEVIWSRCYDPDSRQRGMRFIPPF